MNRTVITFSLLACLTIPLLAGCKSSAEVEKEYDVLPKLIQHTPPAYPERFLLAQENARVLLNLRIDENGNVGAASIAKSSGDAELDQEALKAARTWKYSPAIKAGKPIALTIRQQVEFSVKAFETVTFYEVVVSRRELADSLWELLSEGADFSRLATDFSEASSATKGGLRETVRYDALPAIVKIMLQRLSPNRFSQPFERPDGRFMIVKTK